MRNSPLKAFAKKDKKTGISKTAHKALRKEMLNQAVKNIPSGRLSLEDENKLKRALHLSNIKQKS